VEAICFKFEDVEMAKSKKEITVMSAVGIVIAVATAITLLGDVSETVDPYVHTTSEAEEEHGVIVMAAETNENAQAVFNAYALRQILLQEIDILVLTIEATDNEEKKESLKEILKSKRGFIQSLDNEQRRQLAKGKDDDNEL